MDLNLFSASFVFNNFFFHSYFRFSQDQLNELYDSAPSVDSHHLAQLLSCASTLITPESASVGLPDFPLDNLPKVVSILEAVLSFDKIKL